jgi:hypothetical protein
MRIFGRVMRVARVTTSASPPSTRLIAKATAAKLRGDIALEFAPSFTATVVVSIGHFPGGIR